MAGDELWFTY